MTERHPTLESFEVLIGTWDTEATHPEFDGVSFIDGVLRWWRDHPTFAQRFEATPAHDTFEGVSQLARTPGDWKDDLRVTYRRRAVTAS